MPYRGYSDEELQKQYSARAAVPEHKTIFERWSKTSEEVRKLLKHDLKVDIRYGPKERNTLDIFHSTNSPSRGILLFFHGGYWQAMDKSYFSFLAKPFTNHGYTVVLPNYSLCPSVSIQEISNEAESVLTFLDGEYGKLGLETKTVHLTGHSAGGHMVAWLLTRELNLLNLGPISSAIALSGIFELEPLVYTKMNDALMLDTATAKSLSPNVYKPLTQAGLLLATGQEESKEFHLQTEQLQRAWKDQLEVKSIDIKQANHFSLLEDFAATEGTLHAAAIHWMQKYQN